MFDTDRKIVAAAILIVSISAVAYLLWWGDSADADHGVNEGQIAMNFAVNGLHNSRFVLHSHKGKTVVIGFTTTTCGSCMSQINQLKRLQEASYDVVIATIDIDSNLKTSDLEALVADKEITWFVGHAPDVGRTYGVFFIPTILVIDGDGVIRYRGLYTSFSELELILQQLQ